MALKITMVGISGSGKTTFSAAVYAAMMRQEFRQFRLEPKADDFTEQVLKSQRFARNYREMFDYGQFPQNTPDTTVDQLSLCYRGELSVPIEWVDYRGGALLGIDGTTERDTSVLLEHIYASNGLIFFVDGPALMQEELDTASWTTGIDFFAELLGTFSRRAPKRKLAIVVVATKYDELMDATGNGGVIPPVLQRIRDLFNLRLGGVLRREGAWAHGMIAVSAVGKDRVKNKALVQKPEPFNVAEAMAFCIGSAIPDYVDQLKKKQEDKKSERDKLEKDSRSRLKRIRTMATAAGQDKSALVDAQKALDRTNIEIGNTESLISPLLLACNRRILPLYR